MKNEVNEEKQRENAIKALGVFELRGLARELGVSSPTTKKRDELISLIIEKIKEGSVVDVNSQRRGRPFKKLNALDSIVNSVLIDDYKAKDYNSVISFMQEDMPIINDLSEEVGTFEGIVRESKGHLCFDDFKTKAKVYMDFNVEGFDVLKTGCKVKAEARKINGDSYWVEKILLIDGVALENYDDTETEKGEEVISETNIPFGGDFAKEGRRNVFCLKEDLFENRDFKDFYAYCGKSKFKLIVLSVNSSYENQIMFRNLNIDNLFVTEYAERNSASFFKVVDTINYAQHLIDKGEKVLVFVADIVEVLRKLDEVFANKEEDMLNYNPQTVLVAQKLLALGRAYENGASGTIIMGYNEIDADDKFLKNDIFKISKRLK